MTEATARAFTPVHERHHEDDTIVLVYVPVWVQGGFAWLRATDDMKWIALFNVDPSIGPESGLEPLDAWIAWIAKHNSMCTGEVRSFIAHVTRSSPKGNIAKWIWFLA